SFGQTLTPEQQAQYLRLRQEPLLAGKKPIDMAPQLIDSLLGQNAPKPVYDEMYRSIAKLRTDTYLKALEAATYFDRSKEIKAITAPTLLLYAEHDRLTPPAMGKQVHDMMPHAKFDVVPGSG